MCVVCGCVMGGSKNHNFQIGTSWFMTFVLLKVCVVRESETDGGILSMHLQVCVCVCGGGRGGPSMKPYSTMVCVYTW